MAEGGREHHTRFDRNFFKASSDVKARTKEVLKRNPKESRIGFIRQLVDWLDSKVGEQFDTPYDSDSEKPIRSTPLHTREHSPAVVFRGNKTELKVAGATSPTNVREDSK